MLKVFLIPMDVLQQEIILLTMKNLKIKGYSKQYLKFKDFPLTQPRFKNFKRVAKIKQLNFHILMNYASSVVITKQCEMT